MNYEILEFNKENQIGVVTISRPKAMNALNSRFFEEMNAFLDEIEKDNEIRVLIITGDGKAFVAGADIAEMADYDSKQGKNFSVTGQKVFSRIEKLPFPVIAAINGFALGGGMELTMACDIRIASTKAKMGQPEVSLGLIPGYAGTQRLSRLIGMGNALYLLTTADMISGQRAYEMGLVQKVVEPDELMNEAMNMAKNISKKGKNAVKKVKEVTRKGIELSFEDGSALEAYVFGSMFDTEETKEGTKAFLEKRKPNW